jgi:hypothetical protein
MPTTSPPDPRSPEAQLAAFLAKYDPVIVQRAEAVLARLRTRLAGANQLVYDNYNALVVAFAPSERVSDVIVSVALYPRWVTMFFLHGAELPDPNGVLKGAGSMIRHVVLPRAESLDEPVIEALLASAVERASRPLDPTRPGRLVIKSISPRQRPRRPAERDEASPRRATPRRPRRADTA